MKKKNLMIACLCLGLSHNLLFAMNFTTKKHKKINGSKAEFICLTNNNKNKKLKKFIIGASKGILVEKPKNINELLDIKLDSEVINCNALMACAIGGSKKVCNYLIKQGAIINKTNNEGRTALSFAAQFGHKHIIKILIQRRARIDLSDCQLWSPLMYAAHNQHKQTVKYLLANGANPLQKNSNQEIAMQLTQNKKIKKILIQEVLNQNKKKLPDDTPATNPLYHDIHYY